PTAYGPAVAPHAVFAPETLSCAEMPLGCWPSGTAGKPLTIQSLSTLSVAGCCALVTTHSMLEPTPNAGRVKLSAWATSMTTPLFRPSTLSRAYPVSWVSVLVTVAVASLPVKVWFQLAPLAPVFCGDAPESVPEPEALTAEKLQPD